jgi:hypothetical protein
VTGANKIAEARNVWYREGMATVEEACEEKYVR